MGICDLKVHYIINDLNLQFSLVLVLTNARSLMETLLRKRTYAMYRDKAQEVFQLSASIGFHFGLLIFIRDFFMKMKTTLRRYKNLNIKLIIHKLDNNKKLIVRNKINYAGVLFFFDEPVLSKSFRSLLPFKLSLKHNNKTIK